MLQAAAAVRKFEQSQTPSAAWDERQIYSRAQTGVLRSDHHTELLTDECEK